MNRTDEILIKGWSSSRIAEYLDVSLITIQDLLETGREKLKRELGEPPVLRECHLETALVRTNTLSAIPNRRRILSHTGRSWRSQHKSSSTRPYSQDFSARPRSDGFN